MKPIIRLLILALCSSAVSAAQNLPPFSSDLYIRFDVNGSVLQDCGDGARLRNRNADEDSHDVQLWQLTGRADSCVVRSLAGNYVFYNAADNRFMASSVDYTPLELVSTSDGKWELQIADKSLAPAEGSVAMVMNGGSGIDREIDLWKHNFAACGLSFIAPDEMDFDYQSAPPMPAEVALTASTAAPAEPLSLWYGGPAANWVTEALPIGGGDFGAMVFGGVAMDRVQFNHKTLWRGSARTGDLGTYLNFGDLYIRNLTPADAVNYRRDLNLRDAVASVSYSMGDADFSREYFASFPDKVIAVRYSSTVPGGLNCELQFISAQGRRASYSPSGATFSGRLDNAMNFCADLRLTATGGTVTASKSALRIEGADEFVVYIACNTDFDPTAANHSGGSAEETQNAVCALTAAAAAKGYAALRADHVADYRALFDRVDFDIEGANLSLPTPDLLKRQGRAEYGAQLDRLVFQYGRYLTIASSRGVALPSNLQGIWCKDGSATSSAVWASDIHSNINVQMNYWPAEPTNLSECHMPFLDYIHNEATRPDGTWARNARDLGVDEGWVVNTAGNIFGGSSNYKVKKYSVVNAWYCEHLWQHYAYTCDLDWLRSTAFPLMKSACRFWFKRLIKGPDGLLECPNEYSPEQGRIQNATAHSQQLVTQLFLNTLMAIEELGNPAEEAEFAEGLRTRLEKLDRGLRIDSDGLLREWKYQENTPNLGADSNYFADDESNIWQGHRHTSHLMALYPGFEIDPGKDADIFRAAVASLDDRGDVATGWARAWRISLWARARDAKRAYSTLRGYSHRTTATSYDWHGGIYDNMLDAHATSVFQIEGNFGATAGIAEMLLQSRPDSIVVLPALPDKWPNGHIHGLKAIGNFTVDLDWAGGKLTSLRATSGSGAELTIAYPSIENAAVTVNGAPASPAVAANLLTLPTAPGDVISITPADESSIDAPRRSEPEISVENRRITSGADIVVYDIAGRPMRSGAGLTPGVYLVCGIDSPRKILVK